MTRKNRYIWAIIAILLFAFLYSNFYLKNQQNAAQKIHYDYSVKTEEGKPIAVARIIDGDTVELINGERLRYIGMDTPEEVDPRKPLQCYAKEAAAENEKLISGQKITFYKDVSVQDKYGRWLGFVYLDDGTFVNLELVKQGYAFAYPYIPDTSKKSEFKAAENQAKQNKLGLWSHCQVHKTSYGREQTNDIK